MGAYELDWERCDWPAPRRSKRRRGRMVFWSLLALAALWFMCAGRHHGRNYTQASLVGFGGPLVSRDELAGPCQATHVVDGDTVDVWCGDGGTRVRLLNVDTPERGRPGFREATEALGEMLGDGDVYLAFEEPGHPKDDRFGRLLAYLIDDDGRNLNEELIREGWSQFYTKYGTGRFAQEFEDAEGEAEHEGVGLWAK